MALHTLYSMGERCDENEAGKRWQAAVRGFAEMNRNDPHEQIKQRLEDWGAHMVSVGTSALGWNVHTADFDAEIPRGIQKRNDVVSNPTAREVEKMFEDEKRVLVTDAAIRELRPRVFRRMIEAKYRSNKRLSDSQIAEQLNLKQRLIGHDFKRAYDALQEIIDGMNYQRFSASKSVAFTVETCHDSV